MTHHYYYYDPKILDLSKMRDECERRAEGDYYKDSEDSVIHYHKASEECNGNCESYPIDA